MEWNKTVDNIDGLTVHTFRGFSGSLSKSAYVVVEEILSGPDGAAIKTGEVGLCASNYRTGTDILRTIRIPADPGEDPCATARAKAEEFVKLFNL